MIRIKDFRPVKKEYQKTVQLFLTQRCDLNCSFCFRRKKGFKFKDMQINIAKRIIDNYTGSNAKISFTGGEPTLNSGLQDLLEYCEEKGISSEIYTNGLHDFNNFSTKVKLRYDGFNRGFKVMNRRIYSGRYELGLLINGSNTDELLKCLKDAGKDPKFSGVLQITEVVGKAGLPLCGTERYKKEAEFIADYASRNCKSIQRIEISVGCLRINTGAPKCRFVRYFDDKIAGTCPHNKNPTKCADCLFQKQEYERAIEV